MQLRNPFGHFEWEGDWSDKSPCWDDNTKAICEWADEDDGIFWMNIQDFREKFVSVAICNFVDSYKYTFLR